MSEVLGANAPHASRALWMSAPAFALCFAAWTIFCIAGLAIADQFDLGSGDLSQAAAAVNSFASAIAGFRTRPALQGRP